jgi:hypothetical protein
MGKDIERFDEFDLEPVENNYPLPSSEIFRDKPKKPVTKKEGRPSLKDKANINIILAVGLGLLCLILLLIAIIVPHKKTSSGNSITSPDSSVNANQEIINLHTFPDGVDSIIVFLGPERWEGVALPLSATAYDISGSNWWQTKTWEGKTSPVYKKGQSAYIPIKRNRNISKATFWIRGEGECVVTINR